jgi:hypothetical protein
VYKNPGMPFRKSSGEITSSGARMRKKRKLETAPKSDENEHSQQIIRQPHESTSESPLSDVDSDSSIAQYHPDEPFQDSVSALDQLSFKNGLVAWAVNHNVNRNAVTSLLHLLKDDRYPDLPYDSRSLLHTPRVSDIVEMSPGQYVYLGLKKSLEWLFEKEPTIPAVILLDFNIDGAPMFKESFTDGTVWPILCQVKNIKSQVFAVAIYGGPKKPDSFTKFLEPFVKEFQEIKRNLVLNGSTTTLKINNIILDAPARSAVCGIAGHTGKNLKI